MALIAVGLACLLAWQAVAQLLVTLAGLYLIFAGVSSILWLIYRPREAPEKVAAPAGRRRRWVAPVLATVLIAGAIVVFRVGWRDDRRAAAGPCNGHEALCDRPLPEVALAATHNSMSAPLPGWYSAAQDAGIADQLQFGIHGCSSTRTTPTSSPAGGCAPTSARARRSRSWRSRTA
jgi:hypothetical protein